MVLAARCALALLTCVIISDLLLVHGKYLPEVICTLLHWSSLCVMKQWWSGCSVTEVFGVAGPWWEPLFSNWDGVSYHQHDTATVNWSKLWAPAQLWQCQLLCCWLWLQWWLSAINGKSMQTLDMPARCFNNSPSHGLSDPSNFTSSKKIHLKKQAGNGKFILFINIVSVNTVCLLIWYKLSWHKRSKKQNSCLSPVWCIFNEFSLN